MDCRRFVTVLNLSCARGDWYDMSYNAMMRIGEQKILKIKYSRINRKKDNFFLGHWLF